MHFYLYKKQNRHLFSLHSERRNGKHENFGRELVFSADLVYNGISEKPPSEREGDRVSGGRSLRDFRFALTSL